MDYGRFAERLMIMDDAAWQRHANPWSALTRAIGFPLLVLAIWSRTWIGWWSLVPILLTLAWIWLNPRAFPPPETTDNWASKGTFGERVWLNRKTVPIPAHHARMAHLLSGLGVLAAVPFLYGLIMLEPWPTWLGLALVMLAKIWFVDRMVWLYEDMKDQDPTYRSWLRVN